MLALAEIAVGLAMARDPSVSSYEARSYDSGLKIRNRTEDGRPNGLVRYRCSAERVAAPRGTRLIACHLPRCQASLRSDRQPLVVARAPEASPSPRPYRTILLCGDNAHRRCHPQARPVSSGRAGHRGLHGSFGRSAADGLRDGHGSSESTL